MALWEFWAYPLRESPTYFIWKPNQMEFPQYWVKDLFFLLTLVVSSLFDMCCSHWCEMITSYCFDLHLSNSTWRWTLFPQVSQPSVCFLWWSIVHLFQYWVLMGLLGFYCGLLWVLSNLEYWPFIWCIVCKYSFLFSRIFLILAWVFFCYENTF